MHFLSVRKTGPIMCSEGFEPAHAVVINITIISILKINRRRNKRILYFENLLYNKKGNEQKNMDTIYLGLINVSSPNAEKTAVKKAVKILFRKMIRRLCPSLCSNLQIKTGQRGKPYLAECSSWHFNISHTGNMGVCAVARIPIGVDIEQIDKRRKWKEIAKQCFHKQESEYLRDQPSSDCTLFYHIWTRKEAWLKLHDMSVWQMSQVPCCFDECREITDVWTWEGSGLMSFSLSLSINGGTRRMSVRFMEEFVPHGIHLQQVRLSMNDLSSQSVEV
jgi:hypothetical protein